MPEYTDIYVLSGDRTPAGIAAFLDAFIPKREETASEYEVPQYSDSPKIVLKQARDLIDYCCTNLREVHAIYWQSIDGSKPEHAMVFFLPDEYIIYGLSTNAGDEQLSHSLFERLKKHLNSEDALLCYEECPPDSADAFRTRVRNLTN